MKIWNFENTFLIEKFIVWNIYVDVLSCPPHFMEETTVKNLIVNEVGWTFCFEAEYRNDESFCSIVRGLEGWLPKENLKLEKYSGCFHISLTRKRSYYTREICTLLFEASSIFFKQLLAPLSVEILDLLRLWNASNCFAGGIRVGM